MSLIDWAKANPVVAGTGTVVATGALCAGVFFSGVLTPPEATPDAVPVASATATATAAPSGTPGATQTPAASPSATTAVVAPSTGVPTPEPSASATPTSEPSPSNEPVLKEEELVDLGEHQQEPEANTNEKEVAEAFGKAYGAGNVGKDKWIKAMTPHADPVFLEGFKNIDEQWIAVEQFEKAILKEENGAVKIFELHFKSGLVEVVRLTLADDYQTWKVSDFN